MGNKASTDSLSTSQPREENVYEEYTLTGPAPPAVVRPGPSLPPLGSASTPPPLARPFPGPDHRPRSHGLERRSMTIVGRGEQQRKNDTAHRRLSTSDATLPSDPAMLQDTLQAHVVSSEPQTGEEGVELAAVVAVVFNRDIVTVNASKLFEIKCDMDTKPIEGHTTYDAKTLRVEFIPHNTLHPDTPYTVILLGRAVTTVQCPSNANITNAQFTFKTCNPPPKNIGIKLKGHRGEVEKLQIANYYDLYNSLIVWSTKQWGCSGEHIMGLYAESDDRGRMQVLKADHDILRLRENEVVVVEIKD